MNSWRACVTSDAVNPLHAILLGIVEGLTEYLPVSSTGHLTLVSRALGLEGEAVDSFDVVIQAGAIFAVVIQYRKLLAERIQGLTKKDPRAIRLLSNLVIAFLPMAVLGLLFRKTIKAHLFGPIPVVAALGFYGVVMLVTDGPLRRREAQLAEKHALCTDPSDLTPKQALAVGLGQCLALVPGTSRSMGTILFGRIFGVSTGAAAEFSFLLGLPTLSAATLLEGWKSRGVLAHDVGALNLVLGFGVSFLVAWAVVRGFVAWLSKHGLAPFGVYRILLAAFTFWFLVVRA